MANRGPASLNPATGSEGPSGGLQAALTPVMKACGGIWVSALEEGRTGPGRATPGDSGVSFPFEIKEVPIPGKVYDRFYNGFSNSSLWPLCHQSFVRPRFSFPDWSGYEKANVLMANAVAKSLTGRNDTVFIQDFHFCLLPKLLRDSHPDLDIAFFWHIPWPSAEVFSVCPWSEHILTGLSACDYLGFQIQQYCNNFIETMDRSMECFIDREQNAIVRKSTRTLVRAHPISIDTRLAGQYLCPGWEVRAGKFMDEEGIPKVPLIVGIDRADYTKGIPEKLLAFESVLESVPSLKGRIHMVQVATPTRAGNPDFDTTLARIKQLTDRINATHGTPDWRPLTLIDRKLGHREVHYLYRLALACVVSSLHDGMNLVAKEFVASRSDGNGVLVLSKFTGSARELGHGALLFNPFDQASQSAALLTSIGMSLSEQQGRMAEMRAQVLEHNVFSWAANLLSQIRKSRGSRGMPHLTPKVTYPIQAETEFHHLVFPRNSKW